MSIGRLFYNCYAQRMHKCCSVSYLVKRITGLFFRGGGGGGVVGLEPRLNNQHTAFTGKVFALGLP